MLASLILIWILVAFAGLVARRRSTSTLREGIRLGLDQARPLVLRMPLAILIGSFLVELLPRELLRGMIGEESGFGGILIASVAGGLLPGGPFVSFPVAVAFYKAGVGVPQMMALLTAWSVYAIHRVLIFELPLLGGRFVLLRFGSCIMLPPLAGVLAALALGFLPIHGN